MKFVLMVLSRLKICKSQMSEPKTFNLIISGIGGQGVFTLTKVIWSLCDTYNYKCQGATFKGGAQRLGSVHSELRILFHPVHPDAFYSNQIVKGSLDLILGLEPWETLRYQDYFNKRTRIIMNTLISPLYIERYRTEKLSDPVSEIKKISGTAICKNFSDIALTQCGDIKMTNFVLLMESVCENFLPFKKGDVEAEFYKIINSKDNIINTTHQ